MLGLGCTSLSKSAPRPTSVVIQFKARAGDSTETRYASSAHTRLYSDAQLTRETHESVDFTVRTKTVAVGERAFTTVSETTYKDGRVGLHDLAFPELHEQIEFITQPDGTILKAGSYPPQSLFFVPSIPIPDRPVAVGDTWTMEKTWASAREGLPLTLDVVAILKEIVPCETNQYCADIEVSGHVTLGVPPNVPGARFSSRVWGRTLFSLSRGDVLWSEMRSQEDFLARQERSETSSCMVSEMRLKSRASARLTCDPEPVPTAAGPKF